MTNEEIITALDTIDDYFWRLLEACLEVWAKELDAEIMAEIEAL